MKKVKVLTALLISLMIVLTACGGGGKSDGAAEQEGSGGNTVSTESGGEEQTSDLEAPPEDDAPAEIDLGGRTIKMAAWWDLKPAGNTAGEKASLEKREELEKKYNFKFEYLNVPFEEYWDKFTTTVLAGEPFADILIMEYKRAIVPAKQGQLLPLREFTNPTSDINNEQRLVRKLPTLAGEEYAFNNPGVSVVGVHYNRDIFKRLGLPDLQELYNKGEWTWEKFIEIARQATRDTDNDGKVDVYGLSGSAFDMARHFAASNGIAFVDPNTLEDTSDDPKMIEALEFVNRIYNVENVIKNKSGDKLAWQELDTFKDGDVAMSIQYDWSVGDLTFEVGVVPVPQGPQGSPQYTYANAALNAWFIPKGVQDPHHVYRIFEEMSDLPPTEEYLGQDWLESRYMTEEDIRIGLEHINGTGMIFVEEGIPDYPFFSMMGEIFNDNQSVTATIEKYKNEAVAALEKVK
jgi:multiple sugar transport system substrate-binding protein